ncbi:hypothetical protein FKP32DRAFT_1592823 [Trametes sanguinea]|nr:hypothetical protein FKP32DRAFT_1592823 [Trametes sanguinea]
MVEYHSSRPGSPTSLRERLYAVGREQLPVASNAGYHAPFSGAGTKPETSDFRNDRVSSILRRIADSDPRLKVFARCIDERDGQTFLPNHGSWTPSLLLPLTVTVSMLEGLDLHMRLLQVARAHASPAVGVSCAIANTAWLLGRKIWYMQRDSCSQITRITSQ